MKKNIFIREVKNTLYYILEYGIKNTTFRSNIYHETNNPEKMKLFVEKVHEGFMAAQKSIIHNLLKLSEEKKNLKYRIKELRRNKVSNEQIQWLEEKYDRARYQELIFRKLADTIAWQLLEQDLTAIRRLYNFASEIDISNSNLDYDVKVAEDIFNDDKTIFPLLTDITSFIQVGDILAKDYFKRQVGILELKEGKVNEKIEEILDSFSKTKCDYMLYRELKDRDKNFSRQFKRYIKQQNKIIKTIDTINKGEGVDYSTGFNVKIPDDVFITKHFEDKINKMLQEVDKKNYSITVIDNCLFVGVYNRTNIPIDEAFSAWVKGFQIEFPEVDIIHSCKSPLSYPIFLHPFSIQDKVKLVSGEKCIKLSLDIKKWLELLKEYGINYRWLSRKETARINSRPVPVKAFEINGQAIELEYEGIKETLYDGIFGRMVYQFLTPMSAIEFIKHTLEQGKLLSISD